MRAKNMHKVINLGLLLALIVVLAAPLAACGRKGAPEAPPGNTYPRNYPEY